MSGQDEYGEYEWESWSYTEETGWGTRITSGRTKRYKSKKPSTFDSVMSVLQKHESRCLDNEEDRKKVAKAVTKFIKSM
jgi:hypothetical protein